MNNPDTYTEFKQIGTLKEIHDRLRRRYLDRLNRKLKLLRRLLIERNWQELKLECQHLATSGENFGFQDLTRLALEAHRSLPAGKVSRAHTPLHAKENLERLITALDTIMIENSVTNA